MMGEVGKLQFLLSGRIFSSLIGSFRSPRLFMLGSFHSQSCTLLAWSFLGERFCLLFCKNVSQSGASMDLVGFESHCNQLAAC